MKGRIGFAAVQDGQAQVLTLIDGAYLRAGGKEIHANASLTGQIERIMRKDAGDEDNAFVTKAALPAGADLAGRWLMIELGDGHIKWFPIDRAVTRDGRTRLVTPWEPGFSFESGYDKRLKQYAHYTQYLFHPRQSVLGGLNFRVTDCAAYVAGRETR
jgi:hypothetical protein